VLSVDPDPLVETRRDGRRTEDIVYTLLKDTLRPGWSLQRGARLLGVDGEPYPNQRLLKGEADLLLVDPDNVVQVRDGSVGIGLGASPADATVRGLGPQGIYLSPFSLSQAVIEVKTAGGNLFLAMYEDVTR
jgi:hypothetical protein